MAAERYAGLLLLHAAVNRTNAAETPPSNGSEPTTPVVPVIPVIPVVPTNETTPTNQTAPVTPVNDTLRNACRSSSPVKL